MSVETPNNRITAFIDDGLLVTSKSAFHQALTDEPIEWGGSNKAMNPTDLFLSALASCKLTTMRMVASRKNWNTHGLSIILELSKVKEVDTIYQTISFPDGLTDEQRNKLTTISHKCPVAKLVTGNVQIVDTPFND